ncbi:hypothetical protein SDC9_167964 [bioreactor metagenome]|uniref:Uncharacterized protein n=1 Tax=bioreactor metagenome TaxID=1076179 RepID=A0A645G1S3_9ZZZZ
MRKIVKNKYVNILLVIISPIIMLFIVGAAYVGVQLLNNVPAAVSIEFLINLLNRNKIYLALSVKLFPLCIIIFKLVKDRNKINKWFTEVFEKK